MAKAASSKRADQGASSTPPAMPNRERPPEPRRHEAGRDELLEYYRQMLLIRRFEERAGQLYGLGLTNRRLTDTYPLWSVYQRAWFNRIDDLSRPFLSFLNVRYAVGKGEPPEGWRVLAEDRGTRLFENTRELPRAFVPRFIHFERDSARVLEAMKEAAEFVNTAWIETGEIAPGYLVNGRGHVLLRRGGLAYELDAAMEQAGWVVVSATHWKGWRAYIDGRRVRTYFANHAFLGVYVPKGQHRVTLTYLPQSFTRGRAISLVTALALLAFSVVRRCRPFFSTSQRQPR